MRSDRKCGFVDIAKTTQDRALGRVARERVPVAAAGVTRFQSPVGDRCRGGRWYVVGYCHLRLGLPSLRVDRIAHADISQRSFIRLEAVDAAAYLARAVATLPRTIPVEVTLRTDLATAAGDLRNAGRLTRMTAACGYAARPMISSGLRGN